MTYKKYFRIDPPDDYIGDIQHKETGAVERAIGLEPGNYVIFDFGEHLPVIHVVDFLEWWHFVDLTREEPDYDL